MIERYTIEEVYKDTSGGLAAIIAASSAATTEYSSEGSSGQVSNQLKVLARTAEETRSTPSHLARTKGSHIV